MRRPSSRFIAFPAVLLCLDCQDPSAPPATATATLEVAVVASGLLTDTTTYGIRLEIGDRTVPSTERIPYAGGSVIFPDVPIGAGVVSVELPPTCWLADGSDSRWIAILADRGNRASFSTSCFGPPAHVFNRLSSTPTRTLSRYVLEPGGVFRLQTQIGSLWELAGTYAYQGSQLRFEFAADPGWTATATVVESCLVVAYNVEMKLDDFEDATYCSDTQSISTHGTPMPGPRWQSGAAALDSIVYVAGGDAGQGSGAEGSILAYDPGRNAWRTVGRLAHPVTGAAMAAIGDRLYVAGGCPIDSATSLQVFEPRTGLVSIGPPLPTPRCLPAAAVLQGQLHVIGGVLPGIDADAPIWDRTAEHDVFDPVTGDWSRRAPMPHSRSGHGAVALEGRIYVAGGQGEGLQVYDPATDAWATYPSPPARWGVATVAFARTLYVIGGSEYQTRCCAGPIPSAGVQRYDAKAGVWDWVPSLSEARTGHAVALVDGTIYVIGGSSTGDAGGALATVERIRP